jgi:hypothetical protein
MHTQLLPAALPCSNDPRTLRPPQAKSDERHSVRASSDYVTSTRSHCPLVHPLRLQPAHLRHAMGRSAPLEYRDLELCGVILNLTNGSETLSSLIQLIEHHLCRPDSPPVSSPGMDSHPCHFLVFHLKQCWSRNRHLCHVAEWLRPPD